MGAFYLPKDGVCGDFIPYYEDGWFYLYYLKDFRDIPHHGEGCPWYGLRSRDLLSWEELGEMIPRGGRQEQDLFAYTGSVFHDTQGDGSYHIFYTGHNPYFVEQGKPQEVILHAVSEDKIHWTKTGDCFYPETESYEPNDWRDPFVFWDSEENCYGMILTARKKEGNENQRGVSVLCHSDTLKSWRVTGNLWEPDRYVTHECPDYFQMGDWWYLIYSEFSDRFRTHYVMSKSPKGPWIVPADDVFDSRAYYAAKSAADGTHRYLFGWLATREGNRDDGTWQWGGNLVVHELYQREDGTLAVRMPGTIREAVEKGSFSEVHSIQRTIDLKKDGDEVCILLPGNEARPEGYCLRFSVKEQRMALAFGGMSEDDTDGRAAAFVGIEKDVELREGSIHQVQIVIEGSCMVAYLDDRYAMSTRLYDLDLSQTGRKE